MSHRIFNLHILFAIQKRVVDNTMEKKRPMTVVLTEEIYIQLFDWSGNERRPIAQLARVIIEREVKKWQAEKQSR